MTFRLFVYTLHNFLDVCYIWEPISSFLPYFRPPWLLRLGIFCVEIGFLEFRVLGLGFRVLGLGI